ncbi:MAG: DNA polymerase II large subunit [Candidatus Bathyarchaeia archaeon]
MGKALPYFEKFSEIEARLNELAKLSNEARAKGLDPSTKIEVEFSKDLAERVEKSVGPPNMALRIRELAALLPREEIAFKIAEEIVYGKFGSSAEEIAEQAVRTALAILGEGVTIAPIEGISEVKEKENNDGTRYLALYFSGPIRSAGGTDMGLILVVADYVRRLLGLSKYRATEQEARRFVEELRLYEREVGRFQFKVSDEELFHAIMHLPVEVTGSETDPIEVSFYRNLPRIETNRLRGGALRVVNDGLIGRKAKILRIVDKLGIRGWDWLREIRAEEGEERERREFMYMEDVIAGRPIFSFPGAKGGFRLRYGKARNTGLAAVGIHPSTMIALRKFIATGTQLKLELPGKAGVAQPVDSIEPPVVKLRDGSVLRLEDPRIAEELLDSIDSILFLGDILVGFGEFLENNRQLFPSGFVEEWWVKILAKALKGGGSIEGLGLDAQRLRSFLIDPLGHKPSPREALAISRLLKIPLHPRYTYFWDHISPEDFSYLRRGLLASHGDEGEITVEFGPRLKGILETLCIPHKVVGGRIAIGEESPILFACLALEEGDLEMPPGLPPIKIIKEISGIEIIPKAFGFIGARMGRPEKANRREMKPLVHCIFPVGTHGGPRRDVVQAAESFGSISVEVGRRRCISCGALAFETRCPECGGLTNAEYICRRCGRALKGGYCEHCKSDALPYQLYSIDLRAMLDRALKRLGMADPPEMVKGVKGLSSREKVPEPLEKGVLRSKYGLSVYKDGTIRFDVTNAPLTHFKPKEIGMPVERLRELGYDCDMDCNRLENPDQLCPLKVHDIIIPVKCADYLVRVAGFLDELLEKFYGLPPYYRAKDRGDLVGHLVIGLSPHTSVGVVGRIIGFTEASVCFAHPFWHAAKRRDCDGDEDSVSLALDVFLNFSRSFLPSKIGGLMDAPLLLSVVINPSEIARQAYNMESQGFPLRFFEETVKRSDPKVVGDMIETALHKIESGDPFSPLAFTHWTSDINAGNLESRYKTLETMFEKIEEQLRIAEAVRAVDSRAVVGKILSTHLLRDMVGNLKAFSGQKFRCLKCNSKFRRIPLKGACIRCGGKLSLTVYKGTMEKYLGKAEELVRKYGLGGYYEQRLKLIREEINSLFPESPAEMRGRQTNLAQFL